MLPREHYLKQTFQDLVNFPEGFEVGGLSSIQARLVRKNGALINALINENVSNPTLEDAHLLKVIDQQASPKTPVEQAWIKYLTLVKTRSTPKKSTRATSK